jgi:hypothetical protein
MGCVIDNGEDLSKKKNKTEKEIVELTELEYSRKIL